MSKQLDFETLLKRFHQPVHCPADLISRIQSDAIREQPQPACDGFWSILLQLSNQYLKPTRNWYEINGFCIPILLSIIVLGFVGSTTLVANQPSQNQFSIEVALLDEISPQMISIVSADDFVEFLISDL